MPNGDLRFLWLHGHGIPKLGCKDFVRNYPSALRIEPLAHFTVERDLMVAMDEFLQHLEKRETYLIAEPSEPHKPHRQTPAQLAKYKTVRELYKLRLVLCRLSRSLV